jgi:formylglycine-generating enzyme required for sulfatase activity
MKFSDITKAHMKYRRSPKTQNPLTKAPWIAILVALYLGVLLTSPRPSSCQDTLEAQGIRFRLIPGGTYIVGSPAAEAGRYADEAQPHRVSLKPFYISVTEITNAQFGRFLKATGHQAPLYWKDRNLNSPNQPVVGVTWFDAVAFCRWLSKVTGLPFKLPTEDQWEAASRGGLVGQPYPWGAQAPDAGGVFRANFRTAPAGATGFSFTAPVGSLAANGYGLFDMAGNVAEWCQDRYVPLRRGGPFKPGVLRLLKGGSFLAGPRDLRNAARQSAPPTYADGYIGFRVVRPAQP